MLDPEEHDGGEQGAHCGEPNALPVNVYEIVVKGRVQGTLLRVLEGFEVVPGRERETCFRGEVADQEELRRVLQRISSFNLSLKSLRRIENPSDAPAE